MASDNKIKIFCSHCAHSENYDVCPLEQRAKRADDDFCNESLVNGVRLDFVRFQKVYLWGKLYDTSDGDDRKKLRAVTDQRRSDSYMLDGLLFEARKKHFP